MRGQRPRRCRPTSRPRGCSIGGGLSIVGNTDDPDLNLPFSLRSRVLFQDWPEDVDGDDETNGSLVFRGYYDGTSPEYIKGDPLLLLNVMRLSDRERLKSLCTDDDGDRTATDAGLRRIQEPRSRSSTGRR